MSEDNREFEKEFERRLKAEKGELEEDTLEAEEVVRALEELLQRFVSDIDEIREVAYSSLQDVEQVRKELEDAKEKEDRNNMDVVGSEVSDSFSKLKETRDTVEQIKGQLEVDLNVLGAVIQKDSEAIKSDREVGDDLQQLQDEIRNHDSE